MCVVAIHDISDPDAFFGGELPELPEGTRLPTIAPSPDGHHAVCIWESDSVDTVRNLVDGATQGISTNQFFEVNQQNAQGLPS